MQTELGLRKRLTQRDIRWTSLKALMEHGQTEWAQNIRSKLEETTHGFIFRISKPVAGYTRN